MATANNDFYTSEWASETAELLVQKGFVNDPEKDQIEDLRSKFYFIIHKRNMVFMTVDENNLEKYRQFVENIGEKLNPVTFKEIELWQI